MATIYAGKGKVDAYNPYLSLTVVKSSQSVDGNYSIVSYTLKLHRPKNVSSSAAKDYSFTVAGTKFTGTYTMSGSGEKVIKSGTLTVPHNADGSKSISYSMSVEIAVTWSGVYIGTVSNSGTLALPTIPRATQITIGGSTSNMGDTITINCPRASSSFTHDLAYSFEGGSYVSIGTGVGTSKSWVIPDLADKIPNAASGTLKVRCITKNGSTTIGTTYKSVVIFVPETVVPTVLSVRAVEATSGLATQFGAFIQGKSKITATITAEGVKGSTIKEYQATFNGKTYTGKSWTSDLLNTRGTLTIKARVKDSRGRWSEYTDVDVTVLPYWKPQIEKFEAYRCNADGTENTAGEYVCISYKYSVATLNNKNTARMTVSYKLADASAYTSLLTNTALSADQVVVPSQVFANSNLFDLKMELTDWFGVTPYTTAYAIIPSEEVIFDIKADGLGFAVGGVASLERAFESFWQIKPSAGMLYDILDDGADLNTLTTSNVYRLMGSRTYSNAPTTAGGILEVFSFGGVYMQRYTAVSTDRVITYLRFFHSSAWTPWRDPYGWEIAALTAATGVTIGTMKVRYNPDLSLVEMHGSFTYTPTAPVAAGASVTLAKLPDFLKPPVNAPLSVYRIASGTGWVKAAANTDGDIVIRTGGALTANASATYFLGGTFYHDF